MLKTYSGIGTIFMAPINADGTIKTGYGYKRVGDAHPMSVQVNTETKKHQSREADRAGQTLATKTTIAETVGTLVIRQWNAANLAWALSGKETLLSVAASSVTDEAVTAVLGDFVRLAHPQVSNLVVQDVTDITTYVEGTDYEVNANLGLIKAIDGGGISDSDVLHIDYDYAADAKYEVSIGEEALVRVAILADLKNEYTGDSLRFELDSVVLNTTAEINFISEADSEHEQLAFSMSLETLDGNTSPGKINGVEM